MCYISVVRAYWLELLIVIPISDFHQFSNALSNDSNHGHSPFCDLAACLAETCYTPPKIALSSNLIPELLTFGVQDTALPKLSRGTKNSRLLQGTILERRPSMITLFGSEIKSWNSGDKGLWVKQLYFAMPRNAATKHLPSCSPNTIFRNQTTKVTIV